MSVAFVDLALSALNADERSSRDAQEARRCFTKRKGAADVGLASCMFDVFGVTAADTSDETGAERFNAFSPGTIVGGGPGVYQFPVDWVRSMIAMWQCVGCDAFTAALCCLAADACFVTRRIHSTRAIARRLAV